MNTITIIKSAFIGIIFFISNALFAQQYLEFLDDENLTYQEIVDKAKAHFDEKGRGKHTGYKQFLRWKYFAQRKLDSAGKVISDRQAVVEYQQFLKQNPSENNRFSAAPWVEKGPLSAVNTDTWSSHIGRITNIGIDPNNDAHLIVTSPGGGVWKSTNSGNSWTPLFDQETSLSVWSALISNSNSNHYFVGTSGNGIRRSTNGGASWQNVSGDGGTIYTIKMHPFINQILLACSSDGNVYRSTDGGSNWTAHEVQSNTTLYDLEFKPGDPNTVYVSGRSGLLKKSTDNGITWADVSGPWADRSLMMAVSDQAPNYLYVLQESGGGFGGVFLSRNSGTSFQTMSDNSAGNNNIMGYNLNEGGGQAPRDMDIIVSPTDTSEVHVAGVMTFKSTNSGANWVQTTQWTLNGSLAFVHADIDQLIYHNNKIYVASDGGVFVSDDGANTFEDKTTGLGTRQFYRIAASNTEVGRVAGGSQDNGTGVLKNGIWYDFMGADGMEPIILNEDEDIIFGSIQYGSLYRSTDGGQNANGIGEGSSSNGSWVTPLEKDPILQTSLYQAKRHVYKSEDNGSSWETISNIEPAGNTNADELCIAPGDNNIIYVSYSAELFKTADGGVSWSNVTPSNGNVSYINYISIHPINPNRVIIAVSGDNKFMESIDGGTSWSDVTFNLPNMGSSSAVYDGTVADGIYVSMNKGIYYKDDNSPNSWFLMDTGLPNVETTELEIIGNKIYTATYGRGLWEMTIPGNNCTMRPNVIRSETDDLGNEDPTDDTFTFSLDPSGIGLSGTYNVSGDVSASNISFGTLLNFDNNGNGFLVNNGAISVTITPNNGSQNCPVTFKVNSRVKIPVLGPYSCDSALVIRSGGVIAAPGPSVGGGASTAGRNANWYTFIAPTNGRFSVYSCESGEDTNLKIHTGNCGDLTLFDSSDDNCSMGPGLNNYASILADIEMTVGDIFLIEWDSRWSTDPFDFYIDIEEDCPDDLIVDATGLQGRELFAKDRILLKGDVENIFTIHTPGELILSDSIHVFNGGLVESKNEPCPFNVGYNWTVFASTEELITDNNFIEIALEVPDFVVNTIQDLDILIDLEHTYVGDLEIEIFKPSGESIKIWDNNCGGADNLHFILDENGGEETSCGNKWREGGHVFHPGVLPSDPLNTFYGTNSIGTWKIKISDLAGGDQGKVNQVGLLFR